jgi:sulfur-carrier protein adenylyltransferase/sulfurtransferase
MSRYIRQTILPEVGDQGQKTLTRSHILVIGAGGLAAPVLQYLAGAGIGQITLVDPDTVDESNLHRQTLFGQNSIRKPKVDAAQAFLQNLNPDCTVTPLARSLSPDNAAALIAPADLVLDCADSFAASYILSDTCLIENTPLISASVLRLSGYVGGFCASAPSLRAVFPDLPMRAASCASAGVLGPVVGVVGAIQAQMALSVLLGLEPSPLGQLVRFDATGFRSTGFRFDTAPEPVTQQFRFIGANDITAQDFVVELRDIAEAPTPATPAAHRHIVADFGPDGPKPALGQRAVMCCASGLRAWQAATKLNETWDGRIVLAALGHT